MSDALILIIILSLVLIGVMVTDVAVSYNKESKYIKMEIARSCTRNERIHWQHELKRLRKRYFPFLYLFDRKKK